MRNAVDTVRDEATISVAAAFRAWSWGGRAKLPGLGTAFASKVAYFAAYDREAGTGPLIADMNTAWSLWALAGVWDSRRTADHYADYVTWAEHQAIDLDCRSDDVERALFDLGPRIRSVFKSLQ